MAVQFINVDLDIESRKSLDYLCLELSSSDIHHLHCEAGERGFFARLECSNGGDTCEADSVINKFCAALESLDERASAEWQAAHTDASILATRRLGLTSVGRPTYRIKHYRGSLH